MKQKHDNIKSEKEASATIHASTVILTRDVSRDQYEILLMRRHRNQAFMGGAYVFPGGRLDEADCARELISFTSGLSVFDAKQVLQESNLTDELAIGLFFAAVRETFEEAGILFAYTSSKKLINFNDKKIIRRFGAYRAKLINNELTLHELAQMENLEYALDNLFPYAHWITPEMEIKRFDTRFFLARAPEGQVAFHDGMEMTNSIWITPCAALERHQAGEITLMPPTLKILEELSRFDSTDQLFAILDSHKIYPILPQQSAKDDKIMIMLPHDPEYTINAYKQPPNHGESSRIVLHKNIWRTERVD